MPLSSLGEGGGRSGTPVMDRPLEFFAFYVRLEMPGVVTAMFSKVAAAAADGDWG